MADQEIQRHLRRVVKRYSQAGEPLPTEYVELCEEHKVDTTYAPSAPPKPVKKAPAKKARSKKK